MAMSALPLKADIVRHGGNVRFVPKADILHCGKERRYSITSSASYRYLSCEAEYSHFRNGARMITLGEYSIS